MSLGKMRNAVQKSSLHDQEAIPELVLRNMPATNSKISALDGLRGLAVIEVFLYHARTPSKNAGWIGVELFLALSGFVITRSLIGEWQQTGNISFLRFFKRRIARIYPALILLIVSYIAISLIFYRRSLTHILSEVVPSFFGVANWTRAAGLKFPKDLAHLWSVSVELQLYIVWAPIVLFLLRRSSKSLLAGTVLIAIACFSYRSFLISEGSANSLIYNNTISRALPFLLGAAAAVVTASNLVFKKPSQKSQMIGTLIFLGALVCHFYELRYCSLSHWGKRDFNPLLISFSSAVIVWAVAIQLIPMVNRLCSTRILHYLGKISYGVFLWHYPLLMMLSNRVDISRVIAAAALSLILGALSFELVEKRFLR